MAKSVTITGNGEIYKSDNYKGMTSDKYCYQNQVNQKLDN